MNRFIHVDHKKLKKQHNIVIFLLNFPSIYLTLTLGFILLLNSKKDNNLLYYYNILRLLTLSLCYSFFITLVSSAISHMLIKYHKLHTFIEISDKVVIVSKFSQAVLVDKKPLCYKSLYIIPLDTLDEVKFYKKHIIFSGKIRAFNQRHDWLYYTTDHSGIHFENWWYDDNGAKEIDFLKIKNLFPRRSRILTSIRFASTTEKERQKKRKLFHEAMLSQATTVLSKERSLKRSSYQKRGQG